MMNRKHLSEEYLLAVYQTNFETLRAESFMRDKMIAVKPVIKPTRIRSACGMALQISLKDKEDVMKIHKEEQLDFVGFFQRTENEKEWKKLSF